MHWKGNRCIHKTLLCDILKCMKKEKQVPPLKSIIKECMKTVHSNCARRQKNNK